MARLKISVFDDIWLAGHHDSMATLAMARSAGVSLSRLSHASDRIRNY